jgi:hypothetical protein
MRSWITRIATLVLLVITALPILGTTASAEGVRPPHKHHHPHPHPRPHRHHRPKDR